VIASRYDLSDKAWDIVADLFVGPIRRGGPRRDDRKTLNGILWVLRSGAPWRDLLDELGPWSSVYQRYRDWRNQRVFDQMLKRLQLKLNEHGQIDLKTWMIDSTAVRASCSSAGTGKKGGLMSLTITL
jgi:transposase